MTDDTKVLALFVFILSALTLSQNAGAAITVTPSVDGLSGGTFKPLTTPAIAGSNFAASGKVLINGRFVTIPGYIPPASHSTSTDQAGESLDIPPA